MEWRIGKVKPTIDWVMVDLTFGVVAASLPALSSFLPKSWTAISSTGHFNGDQPQNLPLSFGNHPHNNQSAVMNSRQGNGFTGTGRSRFNSEENIMWTDGVDLSYQRKEDLEASSAASLGSRGLSRRSDLKLGQDKIVSKSPDECHTLHASP